MNDTRITLGQGEIGHDSIERHSDRWGAVHLVDEAGRDRRKERGHADPTDRVAFTDIPAGKAGDLLAIVIEDNNKPYVSRLGLTIQPRAWKAKDGDEILLGTGTLFTETPTDDGRPTEIGVKPLDGRDEDWMETVSVLGAEVRLVFQPH
jgi:hypothetical protein